MLAEKFHDLSRDLGVGKLVGFPFRFFKGSDIG
jgi:hypothetical protein